MPFLQDDSDPPKKRKIYKKRVTFIKVLPKYDENMKIY
jgi:hypothetical protein